MKTSLVQNFHAGKYHQDYIMENSVRIECIYQKIKTGKYNIDSKYISNVRGTTDKG